MCIRDRFLVVALQQLPPSADCDTAAQVANARGNQELDLARVADKEYDAETDHGATQGATFR